MSVTADRTSPFLLAMGGLGLAWGLAACSQVSPTLQREQSSDFIPATGALAATAFRATAVAAVRQPVTTTRLGLSVLWHRPKASLTGNVPLNPALLSAVDTIPGRPEFEQWLDKNKFPPAENGSLHWLVDGPEFFPELHRQIAAARRSIDVQVFIFDNDDIGVATADALKARSQELPVRVMFDDLGSSFAHTVAPETPGPPGFVPPANMRRHLKQDSRVRVRRSLNPWLICDHTKLFVFDQEIALLGGMNLGREYASEWHDLMVRVEGPVVKSLARDFNRTWRKTGPWGDLGLFRTPAALRRPASVPGELPIRVLRTDPAEGRFEILESALQAIRGARRRIWIETPYFAHADLATALQAAARRGVDARVILPSRGDSTIMDAANLATANALLQAGVKVVRYPRMTHLKLLICDDWASFGSANMDTLSMRINRELNIAFSSQEAVETLTKKVFLTDYARSRPLRIEETEGFPLRMARILADQL